VNWDRWAAPDEQLVFLKDKPIYLSEIERSERLLNVYSRVFETLWWRECCLNIVQYLLSGLFRIDNNFLNFSKAIYGIGCAEHSGAFSEPKCHTHFA